MRKKMILALGALLLLAACATLKGKYEVPVQHPEKLAAGKRPVCTECHETSGGQIPYARFNHTVYFADSHRQEAYQSERLCAMCHQTSFCNDCHATRVELKPSLKEQTDTFRRLPHRGDYLSRHMIDGQVDPTSCFRCHGNPKTTLSCRQCHG